MAGASAPYVWRSYSTKTSHRLRQPHVVNITSSETLKVNARNKSGNKSIPLQLQFGKDFTHLKTLRDICILSIRENKSNSSVSNVYNYLYGPKDDLKGTVDKVDSLEIEHVSQLGSWFFLHEIKERSNSFTENVSRLATQRHVPVSWQCRDLTEMTRKFCEVKINASRKGSTVQQKHKGKSEQIPANVTKSCAKIRRQTTGIPIKPPLDDLICSHTERGSGIEIIESMNSAERESHKIRRRFRISLQYFRNTRQLRIMLHTVEGLKDCSFDIHVQLTLIGRTNKQKATTRKHRVNSTKADLNEVFYMEPHDGKINGKFLRIRLYKGSIVFCRKKPFVAGIIPLEDIELSVNTTMWLTLKTKLSHKYGPSEYELEHIPKRPEVEGNGYLMQSPSLDHTDQQLLTASMHSHAYHRAMLLHQTE